MQEVKQYSNQTFEDIKRINEYGGEYWEARELQVVLEYSKWGNFVKVIEKAKEACRNSQLNVDDHFADVGKMVDIGSGTKRAVDDLHLSRYACYLIVQNSDPRKEVVALGQTYFAIQTRRQEQADHIAQMNEDAKRLAIRNELKGHNKKLVEAAKTAGVETSLEYAVFQDHGYMGLYGGMKAKDIHCQKGLKKSQKILDHMGSTELAANLFRATQTEEKLRRDSVQGKTQANRTHFVVGAKVRKTIEELGGIMPEDLPVPDKSVKKIETKQRKQLGAGDEGRGMRADIKERVAMIERGEVPEGYKKNKSDIIPEEWKVARLGDYVIDMKSGLSRKLNDTDIGLPVIRSNNIADNKVNFSNIKYWYMDDPQGADTKTYFLQDGDILVNFINSISQIGKAAIFRNEVGRNVIFTTNILKMTLCNKLNTSYFLYFSETEEYSNYIKSITKPAINQASFTTVEYKRMDLLIPPVFEQQKISSIISIWHRAIELKDKLLEQKKLQKKGLIQQILRNCFEKCKRKEIKEVAEQRVEINSANVSLPVLSCTKYDGLVSSLEYFRRQVYAENLESYKVVRKNWFAYATNHIEEGSIGLQLQYDAGLVSPMYTVFKLNSGMDEEFVFAILKSEIYRRRFKTMMNASVNRRGSLRWNEFSKIKIPVPEYEMQKRMAQIIRVAENEISLLEKEISLLKNQKKGLMQLLLTGKVRVPC